MYWLHTLVGRTADAFPSFWLDIPLAAILTALVFGLAYRFPRTSGAIAQRFLESVKHPIPYVLAGTILPVAVRLACLPWIPPPEPRWHDEFAHLLVADTLAAGRLANPPHPLARHIETQYVLQEPTYSSIYPPGHGIIMSIGRVLTGKPWAGVLLAVGLMGGAITWMLYGCLPPGWAVLGGSLGVLAYGLADEWIDSYYGGAFCAFGGALLFGGLCRLRKSPSSGMALLVGLGWSITWLVRPFESLPALAFAWGCIAWWALGDLRKWKRWIGPALAMFGVQLSAGAFTALHNRAVTGSYTLMPYQLNRQVSGVPQSFLWKRPAKEPAFRFPEAKQMYEWQREHKDTLDQHPLQRYAAVLYNTWLFFVTPWLTVPIVLALALLRKDRDTAVAAGVVALVTAVAVLYPFFGARYIAAYSGVFLFLIVKGLMVVYKWSAKGRVAACFLVVGAGLTGMAGLRPAYATTPPRAQVERQLLETPGRHVVFVRYGPDHSFHDEWVYNAANIDASRIVWCRAMGPYDAEVAGYYPDRKFWLVDVYENSFKLSPYQPEPASQ